MDRRTQRVVLSALVFVLFYLLYRSHPLRPAPSHYPRPPADGPLEIEAEYSVDVSGLTPANSTLGFGAVIAVSRDGSPRRPGLLLAANITEIDITIPSQPQWTDDDVDRLRADRDSSISRGSALAWLGHLNALRWFLASGLETVLIFEDDVDWDIHLRTSQIPHAAAAIRHLTAAKTDPPGDRRYRPARNNYWGNTTTWDLLYLGHCGDIFRPASWSPRVPRVMYPDPTLPPRIHMHPYTAKFLESIGVPVGVRVVHQSIFPLCTFGFALTRPAARRLLDEVAARESDGGTMAYDVRVLEACRDYGFRCWSTNPELFHHMNAASEIAIVNSDGDGFVGADEAGRLKPLRGDSAPNIACGARSKNFFTEDPATLAYLRDVVGRQGKCLGDSMEDAAHRDPEDPGEEIPDIHDPRLDDA